jgi:hypothetical protein
MVCLLQLDTTLLLALCVAAAIFATGAARLAGRIQAREHTDGYVKNNGTSCSHVLPLLIFCVNPAT